MFIEEANDAKPIYTADIETDPFEFGKVPKPFVVGFYDGEEFRYFWGPNCIRQFFEFLETIEPGIVYFHNGGRFDFFYFVDEFHGKLMIVNGRILKAKAGEHEFRDSFAIMPFGLAAYKKDEIDYRHLERGNRKRYREEIVSYLRGDCVYLHELCVAFVERFGTKLTIGSTALQELRGFHEFDSLTEDQDKDLRDAFYYGGRVQCFKSGIVRLPSIKVFDVNSMYPFVMRDFEHPVSGPMCETKRVSKNTGFVVATGKNYGAFPQREKDGGITFEVEHGTFGVSIHEWNAALDLGLFVPEKVLRCVDFVRRSSFGEFVDHFYHARKQAKDSGDAVHALFYKFILNSAYGKFAQNPENYFDYTITDGKPLKGWEPAFVVEGQYIIWKKRSQHFVRHNVGTAASITGAARSVLMRAIAKAKNPLYCDTDSIICESLDGVEIDDSKLGAWKLEKTGNKMAIAGKKLYALFQGRKCLKQASKGVKLTPGEILAVCRGEEVIFKKESPSFKWNGDATFIERRVRMTI